MIYQDNTGLLKAQKVQIKTLTMLNLHANQVQKAETLLWADYARYIR